MKNRDRALAVPVILQNQYNKNRAIKNGASTDRLMEQNRALETDQCIHGNHMRKRVPQFRGGKHGRFCKCYWKKWLIN